MSVIAMLTARNLVDVGPVGSLALHQVVADFATAQLLSDATERHREYYLGLADADREIITTSDRPTLRSNKHGWQQIETT
ncbi:MAG: hypothetical protein IPK16_27260 [Anaerolineales bacterium]|nr:hypothetical protein [Anaerolineales bacterium]